MVTRSEALSQADSNRDQDSSAPAPADRDEAFLAAVRDAQEERTREQAILYRQRGPARPTSGNTELAADGGTDTEPVITEELDSKPVDRDAARQYMAVARAVLAATGSQSISPSTESEPRQVGVDEEQLALGRRALHESARRLALATGTPHKVAPDIHGKLTVSKL